MHATEATDGSDEVPRRTVLGTCHLTLLPRIRVFAGHRPVGALPRRSGPGHVAVPSCGVLARCNEALTCNDGQITRVWPLPVLGSQFAGQACPLFQVREKLGGHLDAGREKLAEQLSRGYTPGRVG